MAYFKVLIKEKEEEKWTKRKEEAVDHLKKSRRHALKKKNLCSIPQLQTNKVTNEVISQSLVLCRNGITSEVKM